jgi:hypothetical protein
MKPIPLGLPRSRTAQRRVFIEVVDEETLTRKERSPRPSKSKRTVRRDKFRYLRGIGVEPPEKPLGLYDLTWDRLYDAIDCLGLWLSPLGLSTSKIMPQTVRKKALGIEAVLYSVYDMLYISAISSPPCYSNRGSSMHPANCHLPYASIAFALNFTSGLLKSATFLTTLISAAFVSAKYLFFPSES